MHNSTHSLILLFFYEQESTPWHANCGINRSSLLVLLWDLAVLSVSAGLYAVHMPATSIVAPFSIACSFLGVCYSLFDMIAFHNVEEDSPDAFVEIVRMKEHFLFLTQVTRLPLIILTLIQTVNFQIRDLRIFFAVAHFISIFIESRFEYMRESFDFKVDFFAATIAIAVGSTNISISAFTHKLLFVNALMLLVSGSVLVLNSSVEKLIENSLLTCLFGDISYDEDSLLCFLIQLGYLIAFLCNTIGLIICIIILITTNDENAALPFVIHIILSCQVCMPSFVSAFGKFIYPGTGRDSNHTPSVIGMFV